MPSRCWVLFSIHLSVLLSFFPLPTLAQDEPKAADEVINRYLHAIGAERFPSITTFEERGEIYGNLSNFWRGYRSPNQSQNKGHGTFEFYFKSPNLRYSSTLTADELVVAIHGCDGKVSWYIDAYLERREFKPKPGSEYDCMQGFEPAPLGLRKEKLKIRLTKKKEIDGRLAWEVKVDDPRSQWTEDYYFDTETFLLLRRVKAGFTVAYSDYRDIGGIKLPFITVNKYTNSKMVTAIRELKINAPIDDSRFIEPVPKGGRIATNPDSSAKPNPSGNPKPASPPTPETSNPRQSVANASSGAADTAAFSKTGTSIAPAPGNTPTLTEVNFPNFASCTVAELQLAVPDLKGLKPAHDQGELAGLLDKIGTRTLEIARNTPNLSARESVTDSVASQADLRRNYDYLILTRIEGNVVALNEFRVDLNTGDKFETDAILKDDSAAWAELERASQSLVNSQSAGPPLSQGFATSWVHFYPANRSQATFRYLGEQKLNGHRTLVLAFAQKPESVISPAIVQYRGKTVPIFLQGVAWVDPSEFRIVHLRTDLLSPLPEVSLHRLSAAIEFVPTRIKEVSSLLSLPRQVTVTSEFAGSTLRETHSYSEYRLFRSHSRLLLNP